MTRLPIGGLLVLGLQAGCGLLAKPSGGDAGAGAGTPTPATTAPPVPTTLAAPPPRDVPEFLDRFCDAVARGDRAYINAHTNAGAFSSSLGTDPDAPSKGRSRRVVGGHHADADFGPVCGRIRAQPKGEMPRRLRSEAGSTLVRLRMSDGLASDLIVARNGTDFRLLSEEAPRGKIGATGGGGGGGGW